MAIERVTFTGSMLSGIIQNVVHFNNSDGATSHAAMAAYLQTHWINALLQIHTNNFSYLTMSIQRVSTIGSVADVFNVSPSQGQQAGNAAPPFVAALIQLRTTVPGRKGRGRVYIGGNTIGLFSDRGRLDSGSYAAFQSLILNDWRAKFLSGGTAPITIGVCSRDDPTDFAPATYMDVRMWASVQRRRNYLIGV